MEKDFSKLHQLYILELKLVNILTGSRGVSTNILEGGSKSSKMSATMVGRGKTFWVKERLKR